ncbi:chloride channel protein [Novimethylophilus kurashikiensis]|uniref:chloride channel protein n=1 Tax=Novimethylophilus kurashikiensis TaxID=1825523 RepID=UPI001D131C9E|nr:chloride channel protein [Novimethylophilus kurashikiensis]
MSHFNLSMVLNLKEVLTAVSKAQLTDHQAWRGRLVIWLGAAAVGLITVVFVRLSDLAIRLFFALQAIAWWVPLVVTPLGGMLIAAITTKWFAGAKGSGIPQTIAAVQEQEAMVSPLISLKLALGKILLGASALAVGFSSGREGPAVQIGASVLHSFRRLVPEGFSVHPHHLIMAGGAAGIAAAFNTPLAGIVFAIEELGRKFEQKTNGVVITAIVLSGLVSISLQGNYTYFGSLAVGHVDRTILWPVLVCGLICGVLGGVFSRTLIEASLPMNDWPARLRKTHPLIWAGACGLVVALLGLVSHGAAHGSGYQYTQQMLSGGVKEAWQYAPIKYLATIFTYLSGVPGGIFAPSLSIGAGIGNDLLSVFGGTYSQAAICALCMAAFLAAVTQAPITSFIIVMEMIDGHLMVISLMAVALLSSIVARLFSPPLYAALAITANSGNPLLEHKEKKRASPF